VHLDLFPSFFLLLRGVGGQRLIFFSPFIGNVEGASAPIFDPQEKYVVASVH